MPSIRALARRRLAKRQHHAAAARRRFYARGEAAWQQYKRDGKARPINDVFDEIDARVIARRRRLVGLGEWLAKRDTRVQFPPAPEPLPWDHPDVLNPALDDWEPPRIELKLKPADLDDEP